MPHPILNYSHPSGSERLGAFLRKARRWSLRLLLALVILGAITLIVDQTWVWYCRRIQVSPETTRITSPIEPSGCPDYLAALNAEQAAGVTSDNNSAPLLLQITGTTTMPPAWSSAVQKSLGLPPDLLPPKFATLLQSQAGSSSARNSTYEEISNFDKDESAAISAPWSPREHPDWATWVHDNEQALRLLQAATTRPRYYIPIVSKTGATAGLGEETLLNLRSPPAGPFRALAQICLARAMMRLQSGDVQRFHTDILTNARFARIFAQAPSLPEYLVANAIDDTTARAVQTAANSSQLNAAQVDALLHDLTTLPPFPSAAAQIDGYERYVELDIICKLARFSKLEGRERFTPVNFNRCLRLACAHFDSMTAAYAQPTFASRQRALDDDSAYLRAAFNASGRTEQMILALVLPVYDGTDRIRTAGLADFNLALTALALRAHKLRTGAFPDRLADLPAAAATFTLDPFTAQPLTYHRQAQGYLLYSFGPNQKDDGGTAKSDTGPARTNYDIVVRTSD